MFKWTKGSPVSNYPVVNCSVMVPEDLSQLINVAPE